jgi:hypothetical protein
LIAGKAFPRPQEHIQHDGLRFRSAKRLTPFTLR